MEYAYLVEYENNKYKNSQIQVRKIKKIWDVLNSKYLKCTQYLSFFCHGMAF